MPNQTKKNFKFDIAPATTPKSCDSCVAARKISKVAVEAVRRELAFKKIKLESGPAPLLNKRSLVLGMCALLLTLVSVGVVPLILSSGISRYKPDPVRTTKRSLDRMARALGRYRFHVGTYPTNEEGLEVLAYCQPEEVAKIRGAHPGWKGPYVDRIVKDPWGGSLFTRRVRMAIIPFFIRADQTVRREQPMTFGRIRRCLTSSPGTRLGQNSGRR